MTMTMTGSTGGALDITEDAAPLKALDVTDAETDDTLQTYIETRNRRASDAASGLTLTREEWPDYTDDELVRHFEMFQHYDLDSSGFITPENLVEVLNAMDIADVSTETVHNIIDEVAILTGHDNDGKLSFRDYMHAIRQDRAACAHNAAMDAVVERRASQAELGAEQQQQLAAHLAEQVIEQVVGALEPGQEPAEIEAAEATEPETPAEPETPSGAAPPVETAEAETAAEAEPARARRGSMSALNALAASRIKAFQQVVSDASSAQAKLAAFKRAPVEMRGPMVNSDELHKETLRNKVKAFEVAATFKGKVELKKTWKKVGGASNYAAGQKIMLGGQPAGVAPKKKLSDLP